MSQLRRSFHVTARILSEADGTVEYIASDATLDSYNEVVLPSGWLFDHFEKNAPFVNSHNYWSIEDLLGRVQAARVENGQLIERVQWAKDIAENKLAVLGWKMTVGGFLKAVSVGFRSVESCRPGDTGWNGAVTAAALSAEHAQQCRRIFTKQQQLELSACILGANPSAVAKAYSEQCITDADLSAVGFDDDDLQFLTIAGKATERDDLDDISRALISREMGRITGKRQTQLQRTKRTPNSQSPGKPDGGETASRQAAARADFLRQLSALIEG
ncbi:hypothetical protein JIN85_16925 [Luteolibacter pohnpeiensis]|uniref:Uncharacterized protein n=1 Tax=Luteolibacter pohnpeiensis TaxID=454153 RepID=A0A934VSB1_9BACT|nr:hypothetical protein [Luteolibacter pohnpeiensis]MBK1884106.1 hypothetical protein [Luteolibacter pohnpeiensis]